MRSSFSAEGEGASDAWLAAAEIATEAMKRVRLTTDVLKDPNSLGANATTLRFRWRARVRTYHDLTCSLDIANAVQLIEQKDWSGSDRPNATAFRITLEHAKAQVRLQ
jgi:hypothetical protein